MYMYTLIVTGILNICCPLNGVSFSLFNYAVWSIYRKDGLCIESMDHV